MHLRLPDKDQLALKLIDYPLLNSLLRMVLYERLFRFALIGLVLLALGVVLFTARLWTASPSGFSPIIKLRGLDYVQAWSLRRTALKQQAEGRFDDALYSWRVAVANNPANPDLLRGCLRQLLQSTDQRKSVPIVVGHSRWLLRLTQTNLADLELSASLYQAFSLDDLTFQTLAPMEKQLTPMLEGCYLKALFNRGQFTRFADRWKEDQLRGVTFSDAELPLYAAAHEAGWGC